MKRRTPWIAIVALAGVGTLTTSGCGQRSQTVEAAGPAPVALKTATVELEQVARDVRATGSVLPAVRVVPASKILSRAERVVGDVGQRVERGQLLVQLESEDLEAAADQARAAVVIGETQLVNARAQYERMVALQRRGSATDKNLEDATSGFRVAQAALLQATANLNAAEVMQGYAMLRSPIDGFVTEKRIEVGDMARPGEPLFVIENLERVKVVVAVPESDVVDIEPGQQAWVTVETLQATRRAQVESINPAGDPASRTFEVRLVLANADGRLKSGMFARAAFEHGVRDALFVPEISLVTRGALRGLFVLDSEGRARLRFVRTGRTREQAVEVLSGLTVGERYVQEPPLGFEDGTPVREG